MRRRARRCNSRRLSSPTPARLPRRGQQRRPGLALVPPASRNRRPLRLANRERPSRSRCQQRLPPRAPPPADPATDILSIAPAPIESARSAEAELHPVELPSVEYEELVVAGNAVIGLQ